VSRLSPQQWQAVDRAFERVMDAPPLSREGVLREATGGDDLLASEVRRLLELATEGGALLGESAVDAHPELVEEALAAPMGGAGSGGPPRGRPAGDVLEPGAVVGPWRILSELGRGGMGQVFLAERLDPDLPQRAALKVVRRGMDTDDILLRFRQERRILASLDHPGIGRLLDGGATDDGRPWLAMEHIAGVPLAAWVEGPDAGLDQRVRLLLQVAEAVAYAHRNLVLHRDLKPSNVVVTPALEARLLDFGIAKLLHEEPPRSGPTEPVTRAGRRILTPEWASPEQLDGGQLTTASDVFQLGLLLQWLLEEGSPAAPPRDLRMVARRAMEPDPARRYATATEFAQELARFLEGRPVLARAPSIAYRVRRFVGRNPVPVGATAGLVLMAGLFAAAYTRAMATERDLARSEAERARAALDFVTVLFEGADPAQAGGDTLNVFQLLDRGEAALASRLEPAPSVRAELEGVLGRLFTELGEFRRAEPLLDAALAGPAPDAVTSIQRRRNLAYLRQRQGRFDEAEALLAEAEAEARAQPTADPELLVRVLIQRGGNLSYTAEAAASEPLLREALEQARGLSPPSAALVSDARMRLGTHLMREGQFPEAEELLLQEVEAQRPTPVVASLSGAGPMAMASTGPQASSLVLADVLNNLGNLYQRTRRPVEAEAAHLEALEIRRRLLPADHPDISLSLNNLGTVAAGAGDLEAADAWILEAIRVLEARVGRVDRNVALSIMNLGWIRMQRGYLVESEILLREALELFRETVGPDSPDMGGTWGNLAQLHREQGRLEDAEAAAREALRIRELVHGAEAMHVAWRAWHLGVILRDQGRLGEAEPYLVRSLRIRRLHFEETHPEVTRGRNTLGDLLLGLGRWEEGGRLFADAGLLFDQDPERFTDEATFAWERVEHARTEAARQGRPIAEGAIPDRRAQPGQG
jgi:tetratricopeptide (TPR) repeat protein